VAGWGRDENNRQITSKAKWVEVPVVSESDCYQSDLVYRYITSNRTFCAGTLNGEGPCTGDSGGGFVIKRGDQYVLRGVVSVSIADPNKGCDEFKYLVFTDVSKYRQWIRSHTDRLG
jgi:secreted trypsin-like serine protease